MNRSVSWELNTKMLPTVWQGLAQRPNLQSLTVKFPQSRLPRPVLLIPPMPKLKWLKITDIDPLCYPDDISLLLMGSKGLRHLKLHWSSRMLEAQEPSTTLHSYFGRSITAGYKIPLISLGLQNLFSQHDQNINDLFANPIAEFTFISSVAGASDPTATSFVGYSWDSSWRTASIKPLHSLKMIRGDKISRTNCDLLGKIQGLERCYWITGRKIIPRETRSHTSNVPLAIDGCDSTATTPFTTTPITPRTPPDPNAVSLGSDYLNNIFNNHGASLRHLLLMPQWRLSSEDLARLVHSCPNLEQLGLGVEITDFNILRLLIPFLPRLHALRILDNPSDIRLTDMVTDLGDDQREVHIGVEASARYWKRLRWVGVGDYIFEIFDNIIEREINGKIECIRKVLTRSIEAVHHVEIWSMDRLEL